jgi:hypothetical protein
MSLSAALVIVVAVWKDAGSEHTGVHDEAGWIFFDGPDAGPERVEGATDVTDVVGALEIHESKVSRGRVRITQWQKYASAGLQSLPKNPLTQYPHPPPTSPYV